MTRQYLPTLAELIDRLSIVQLKEIFVEDNKVAYREERQLIEHDIDEILDEKFQNDQWRLKAKDVHAILVIMLSNRCIWESESKARQGGDEQDHLLKFTHSINGIRNMAKNILSTSADQRIDLKVDAFAEKLIADYGAWDIFK
ncbi:MAG: hypothetical protein KGL39_17380 [Patescibacteria group bacterium]|nr:hypothetical protein [Patescibacteria group bacterium]